MSETETNPTAVPIPPDGTCCGGGDEAHNCHLTPPADGDRRPGPLDGCPTPLAWRQVLEAYRTESEPWTVELPQGVIHGRSWGSGPPLYFLCGMGGTSESFCLVTFLLRDLFRCVTFDYAATLGAQRFARGQESLASLSDNLLNVAEAHGDRTFSLFATSFGSLVALTALKAAPHRIPRAVIHGGFAHRQLSVAERLIVRLGQWLPGSLAWLPGAKMIQQQNHRVWFPPLDTSRWEFFTQDAAKVPIQTLSHRGAIIRDTDLRPQLAEIQQPVLLIQCEGDGLVGRNCHAELASGLPHAETLWMHSAGHLPHLTSPHRLAKSLRDFLLQP